MLVIYTSAGEECSLIEDFVNNSTKTQDQKTLGMIFRM